MGSFGNKLKHERENRGFGLDEIASATKINARYLQALEEDDFEQLPTEVFAKGFIRAYAQHIGADAGYLIEQYELERGGGERASEPEDDQEVIREMSRILAEQGENPATHRRRIVAWGVAALGVVVAAVWLSLDRGTDGEASASRTVAPRMASTAVQEPPREGDVAEPVALTRPARAEPAVSRGPAAPVTIDAPPPVREATADSPPPAPRIEPEPESRIEEVSSVPAGAGRITIDDHGVGTGVEERRLVGATDRFAEGQQVWFWTRVLGASSGETIRHVWLREGHEEGTVELRIGGSHWRTQSRKTLRPGWAGSWSVEARDTEGRVLARSEFTCLPPS